MMQKLRNIVRELRPNLWKQFRDTVRAKQGKLLAELDRFDRPVLIAGCQRSGTTMVARIVTNHPSMVKYQTTSDDEYDAAMILAGRIVPPSVGRYCFQTTYLNECWREYLEHFNYQMIWVIRNPYSVIYSMLYNWRKFALNELFLTCGLPVMNHEDRVIFQDKGIRGISKVKRATYAYVGKSTQLCALSEHLQSRLAVADYDDLVARKHIVLPSLFDFVHLTYAPVYVEQVQASSMDKRQSLTDSERKIITSLSDKSYEEAKQIWKLHNVK